MNERNALPGRTLKAGGVTPFTATDYPGKLALVVFVQGCPWRCGYCHNPHLQPRQSRGASVWPGVRELLRRRAGLLDAVVFSGGEPTIDPMLGAAMRDARGMGFLVGLHSAGIYPDRLAEVLPLADWVGFDVKAPFDQRYDRVTGVAGSAASALAGLKLLQASGVDYEVRTTLHPDLLGGSEILELAGTLAAMGVQRYALQVFRPDGCINAALNTQTAWADYPPSAQVAQIAALFPAFTVRQAT